MPEDKQQQTFYDLAWMPKAALMQPDEELAAAERIVCARAEYWAALLGCQRHASEYARFIRAQLERELPKEPELDAGLDLYEQRASESPKVIQALAEILGEYDRDLDVAEALHAEQRKLLAGEPSLDLTRGHRWLKTHVERADRCKAELAREICRFAEANLRLVMLIAKRLQNVDLDLDDRIQQGTLGLHKAIRRFDPRMGFRFSTYATWWIRHSIQRGGVDVGRTIRVPSHMHERRHKIRKARARLYGAEGRLPTIEQVAEACALSVRDVLACDLAFVGLVSLDRKAGKDSSGDGVSLQGMSGKIGLMLVVDQPQVDDMLVVKERALVVRQALATLDDRTRVMMELRYGFDDEPKTLKEIGDLFGVSRERVRQIQEQAEAELAKYLRRAARFNLRPQEVVAGAGGTATAAT